MSQDINTEIAALDYNPAEILSVQGDDTTSYISNRGIHDKQKYIVIHKEPVTLTSETVNLSALENIKSSIFPGAIVLANRALAENTPTVPAFPRAPMTFHIDLPGLGSAGAFTVANPTASAVNAKVDEMFTLWCDKYAKDYSINAAIRYRQATAFSESQLSAALHLNYSSAKAELDVDFKAVSEGKKSVIICEYEQVFYTVTCDRPTSPAQFFADNVTWKDLKTKGVSASAPPAYVSSVSYGRRIFVKMESSCSRTELEAAVTAAGKSDFDINASANVAYKKTLSETSMSVIVLGGGVQFASQMVTAETLKELKTILAESAMCDRKNPGRLFSYACNFMKDDALAVVHDSSKYIETTTTEYTDGVVTLKHTGGYVAQFRVSWKVRDFNEKGEEIVKSASWGGGGEDRTAPFSTDIPLAGNCFDICVKARECTGLAWEWWRTVIDAKNIPLLPQRTFHIYGSTLSPQKSIEPSL